MHVVLEARSPWTLFGLTLVFTQALHDIVIVVMGTLPPDPCSSLPFTLVFTQCHVHASHMHVVLGALPPEPVRVLFLIIICSIRLIRTQCHVPTVRINRLPLSIQHPLQGHPPQDPLQLPLSIQHPALGRSPPRLPLRLSVSIQRTHPSLVRSPPDPPSTTPFHPTPRTGASPPPDYPFGYPFPYNAQAPHWGVPPQTPPSTTPFHPTPRTGAFPPRPPFRLSLSIQQPSLGCSPQTPPSTTPLHAIPLVFTHASHMHVVLGALPPNPRSWTVLNSNNKRCSREHTKPGPSPRCSLGWFLFLFHGNHARGTHGPRWPGCSCSCMGRACACWCGIGARL